LFAIDALFLRLAALYAVLGMSLGIWMGISGDHGQYPTHAHINLLGWVSFALYGLIYRNVPAAASPGLHHGISAPPILARSCCCPVSTPSCPAIRNSNRWPLPAE
jgi:hypothetical protein